jgi:hypothetical protein
MVALPFGRRPWPRASRQQGRACASKGREVKGQNTHCPLYEFRKSLAFRCHSQAIDDPRHSISVAGDSLRQILSVSRADGSGQGDDAAARVDVDAMPLHVGVEKLLRLDLRRDPGVLELDRGFSGRATDTSTFQGRTVS